MQQFGDTDDIIQNGKSVTCGCVRELRETPFHKSHTAMRSFGGVCETPMVSYVIYMRK